MRNTDSHVGRLIAIGAGALVLALLVGTCVTYNRLISSDQAVESQWAQVESVYQRRAMS